jgi:predicted nucleic acid-binding protein
MVIVDTSVWVDHFRRGNGVLYRLLEQGEVVCHSFVVGELACGNLKNREEVLSLLQSLPSAPTLDEDEVLYFIEKNRLMGKGLGLVDVHILAASLLSTIPLWTKDKKLRNIAKALEIAYEYEI